MAAEHRPRQSGPERWRPQRRRPIRSARSRLDVAVDAEVDLGTAASGYLLQARPNVSLPDLEQAAAHEICPYAKATWGNIEVVINLA